MVKSSFSDESFWSVNIDRLWKARIIDGHNLLPKLLPDFISHVEVNGDGGIGTLKKLYFAKATNEFSFATDKIEELDGQNYSIKEAVIEGGLIGSRLISYSFKHEFERVNELSTVLKLTVEYEPMDENFLSSEEQNLIIERFTGVMKAVEGFLHIHPTAYF